MATLSDLLKASGAAPKLPTLPTLRGAQGRDADIQEYLPTEEDVAEAREEMQEEEPNLFFKLLQIPDRLFFGQSIKGALKGGAEEGLLGAVGGFVQNNPIFQVLDAIPGVDIVDDTDFAEVREAFGDTDARSGIGNTILNIVGEIATDPSSFLLPFGKVGSVGKTVTQSSKMRSIAEKAAKRGKAAKEQADSAWREAAEKARRDGTTEPPRPTTEELDQLEASVANDYLTKATNPMGLLEEAVETGSRAMLVFKVPFAEAGWAVGTPRSMDLVVARHLEKWADFLNTSAVTKPLAKAFRSGSAPLRPIIDSETGEVVVAGSRVRGRASQALRAREQSTREYMQEHLPLLESLVFKHGELIRNDKEVQRAIFLATELGVERIDDLRSINKAIMGGRPFAMAKALRRRLLRDKPNAEAIDLKKRMAADGDDWLDAVDEWKTLYPEASLPEDAIARLKSTGATDRLRDVEDLGIDMRRTGPLFDERLAEAAGQVDEAGRATAAALGDRAGREVLRQAKKEQISLFKSLHARDDIDLSEVQDIIDAGRDLMRRVGDSDVAAGLLNTVSELYVPRVLSDQARELLNNQFSRALSNLGRDPNNFVEGFMRGRKFTDLTTYEVMLLTREMGTKLTGFKPLKSLLGKNKSDAVLDKIFDSTFLKALRQKDPEAAELFMTNPAHAWYRRIEQSSRVRGRIAFARNVFHDDSPLVLREDTLGTYAAVDPGEVEGMTPFLVFGDGATYEVKDVAPGVLTGIGMANEMKARSFLAKNEVSSWTTEQVLKKKRAFKDVTDDLHHDNRVDWRSKKSLNIEPKTPSGHKLKKLGKEYRDLQEEAARLRSRKMRFHGLSAENQARLDEIGAARDGISGVFKKAGEAEDAPTLIADNLQRIKEVRASVTSEVTGNRSLRDEIIESIRSETKAKKARIVEILDDAIDGEGVTDLGARFQDELALHLLHRQNGRVALDEVQRDFPEVFERLQKRRGGAKVKWMDEEVAKGLYSRDGLWDRLNKSDDMGLSKYIKAFDSATWFWKAWTVLPPFFLQTRMRDWVSNMVLHAQSGVPMNRLAADSKDSWSISRLVGKAIRGEEDALGKLQSMSITRTLDDGTVETMSGLEVLQKTQSGGLINSGFIRDELIRTGEDYVSFAEGVKGKFWKNMFRLDPSNNSVIQAGFNFAEFGDNHSKLTAFISRWKMGQSADEAVDVVKKWSYDPRVSSNLTAFERHKIRRFIPFYSFAKFAIRTEVNAYFARPGTVSFWEKVHSSAKGGANLSQEEADLLVPEYIKDNFGIPWKPDENGNPTYFLLGGYLAISEVAKVADAIGETFSGKAKGSVLDAVGERVNPLLKVFIENVVNRSFYTQQPIEDIPGESDEIFGWTVSKKTKNAIRSIRLINEVDRLNILNLSDVKRLVRLTGDAVERGEGRKGGVIGDGLPTVDLLSSAFGPLPKKRVVDLSDQERYARAKINAEKSRMKGLLRKRVHEDGRPGSKEDILTISKILAENAARDEIRKQVEERIEEREMGQP